MEALETKKDSFIKLINSIKNIETFVDNAASCGIDLIESSLYNDSGIIFDIALDGLGLKQDTKDLIYWWLYETVDKVIFIETDDLFGKHKKEIDIKDVEDLWKYVKYIENAD